MKSLSSAVPPDPDERVLTSTDPNDSQVFGVNPPFGMSLRLIDASPKRPVSIEPPETVSVIGPPVFTAASAKPRLERFCWFPQVPPLQVNDVIVGVPLPPK